MPRWMGDFSTDTDDDVIDTPHCVDAGEIGRAILEHIRLPTDGIVRFHSEINGKGLLIVLKSGTEERRLIVLGVDSSNKEKLTPADELKMALDRIPAADRAGVLDSLGLMERRTAPADPGGPIASVSDLESVFSVPAPVNYLIEPEIPDRAVVFLAGLPESGKSTLACAWGRDLATKGHGVLLLDRDRNPRAVIRNRLERLGITANFPLFSVWDGGQRSEPPQPDSSVVIDWVRRMCRETGKSPLVIVDSAVSFLLPNEDENSAGDMRSLFNRCRAVTDAGGNVLLLHHLGKNGELRGSSDFGAAADQGFIVTSTPPGTHRLSRLILKVNKTRYTLDKDLVYYYDSGRMVRGDFVHVDTVNSNGSGTPDDDTMRILSDVLRANPEIGTRQFGMKANASGVAYNKARRFLDEGVASGEIRRQSVGRKYQHRLRDEVLVERCSG